MKQSRFSLNSFGWTKRISAGMALVMSLSLLLTGASSDTANFRAAANADRMMSARAGSCAALLKDGRILIAGGETGNSILSSTEFFSVRTGAATAPAMLTARSEHACSTLADGRVLVAGGWTTGGTVLNTIEILDPATGAWSSAGILTSPRAGATASLLRNGKVLISGGETPGGALGSAEIYDPATKKSDSAPLPLLARRSQHAAAVLPNGKVLIAGGTDGTNALDSLELYDPATGVFTPAGKLSQARSGLSATVLLNGSVYFAGGSAGKRELNTAEIYNPKTGTVTPAPVMGAPRANHLAIRLPENNAVLIIGGKGNGQMMAGAELFIPWMNKYKPLASVKIAQASGSTIAARIRAALADTIVNAATSDPTLFPVLATDKDDYSPGEKTTITGTGWPVGATVSLHLERDPNHANADPTDWTVTVPEKNADGTDNTDGSFTTTYDVTEVDANENLTLTGYVGGTLETAQIVRTVLFTDGVNSVTLTTRDGSTQCGTNNATKGSFAATDTVCVTGVPGISGSGQNQYDMQWRNPSGATVKTTSFSSLTSNSTQVDTLNLQSATAGTWEIRACSNTNCNGANQLGRITFTVVGAAQTTLTAAAATGIYGGTVTLSATLTAGANGVSGKTISFALNGNSVGTATTSAAGVATLTDVALAGINAGTLSTAVTATFAGDSTYSASSGTSALTVNARPVAPSITAANKVYDGTTSATITGRSLTAVAGNPVSGVVAGDDVSLTGGTATFNNKNVATGKTVTATGLSLTGTKAGNYTLSTTTATATADITARPLTVTATAQNKVYDGNTSATVAFSDDRISGDTFNVAYTTAAFTDKNVGSTKTVNVNGISINGGDAGNYTPNTTATATANITPRPLAITAVGTNKTYDGTTAATVTLGDNRVAGDALTLAYTAATFADKNVGTAKQVTVSGISISGADQNNYTPNTTVNTTADITARPLTITATGVNKVYDGNTTATVTLGDNRVSGDVLTTSYTTASFTDKNVGTGKPVNVSGIAIAGADAGNYTFNATALTSANITVRAITVTAAADSKTYDGTNSSSAVPTVTGGSLAGTDTGAFTQTFQNRNVGTGKTLTPAGSVNDGNSGNNYTITFANNTTGIITAKAITVTATADTKTYDGTMSSSQTPSVPPGSVMTGDTPAFTQVFDNKNVGARILKASGSVTDGNGGSNYAVTFVDTPGSITPRALVVTATGVNKVYDGTTAATVTLSDNRVAGDTLTLGYTTATFGDKNVGTTKQVTVSGISITGPDQNNYTPNTGATTTASITARGLTITAAGINKVYDGTATATVTLSDDRVTGDALTTSYTSASFTDKNVGTGKPVSVSGISVAGTDAGNYTFNSTASASANITPRAITVTAAIDSKPYDGNTSSSPVPTVTGGSLAGGDTGNFTQTFNNKNAGMGKTLTPAGSVNDGNSGNNYTITFAPNTTGTITARPITVTATADTKTYDGSTSSVKTPSVPPGSLMAGDSANFAQVFDYKNAGSRLLKASGSVTDGNSGNNYVVTYVDTPGSITPRTLTVTATGVNKVYDGTTAATVTLSDDRVANDVLTLAYTSATFADRNVGTKSVSVSGISIAGTEQNNYIANTTTSTTASITARALSITATGVNKVYDGTTTATVTLGDNRVAGDALTLSYTTASFTDKHAGTSKPVSVSGISVSGTDAGNYTFNSSASASANITPLPISVTAVTDTKPYDGTTSSVGVPTIPAGSLKGTDGATFTQTFQNKNAGTGKVLIPAASITDGNGGNNYQVTYVNNMTGVITQASLTITAVTSTKVYDGTTAAAASPTYSALKPGDQMSNLTETYDNPNVGTGKRLSVASYTISDGNNGGNYAVTTVAVYTGVITPASTGTGVLSSAAGVQYSDMLTLTATVSPGSGGGPIAGSFTFMAGTTVLASNVSMSAAAAGIPVQFNLAPAGYPVTASFVSADANYTGSTSPALPITVSKEDARTDFTGTIFAWTSSATSSAATVTLSATVRDITAVDTATDPNGGDITKATVKFVNRDAANAVLCSTTIGLVSAADKKVGTATCNWTADIGADDSRQYTVGIIVDGYYTGEVSPEYTVLTVSKPLTSSFITGGGYIVNANSGGLQAGQTGLKTNFGFNVKYNKNGTNLQGNLNTIVRNGGRVYQIKATAMTSLAVNTTDASGKVTGSGCPASGGTATNPCVATFAGKANIQDITNPAAPVSIDGNGSLQVDMIDLGNVSGDKIAITLWNKSGGMWFSSSWDGGKTVQQVLGGGNLSVR